MTGWLLIALVAVLVIWKAGWIAEKLADAWTLRQLNKQRKAAQLSGTIAKPLPLKDRIDWRGRHKVLSFQEWQAREARRAYVEMVERGLL